MNTFQTQLRGVTSINDILLNEALEYSVRAFYDWGFLGIGAFANVNIPTSGVYGGDFSKLRVVNEPYYDDGQVWETVRSNWVYESGINYSTQPISISGVWVNNNFYGSGDPTYGHSLDYVLGRVVFNSGIPTNSTVNLNYSFKWAGFYGADAEWFKEVMTNSMRPDLDDFTQTGSGIFEPLSRSRVQLPAVIVEVFPNRQYYPAQLGGGQYLHQDIVFNVLTETKTDRNKIADIIANQNNMSVAILDYNNILSSGVLPLNGDNAINQNAIPYTSLIQNNTFYWKKCQFIDSKLITMGTIGNLYTSRIKVTCEIGMSEI